METAKLACDPPHPQIDEAHQPSNTKAEKLAEAMLNFQADYRAGKFSPYKTGLLTTDPERWFAFKAFIAARGLRYADATFESFVVENDVQQAVVDRLMPFCLKMRDEMKHGGGLFLYGPEGTGKDHLMAACLRSAIVHYGFKVVWRDGIALQEESRQAIGDGRTGELIELLVAPHVLAISDPIPPQGMLTDHQLRFVRDVIERRSAKCLATWVTCNVADLAEASDVLTAPVLKRIIDGGLVIRCYWPSRREPLESVGVER